MPLHTFLILLKNAFLPTRGGLFIIFTSLLLSSFYALKGMLFPAGKKGRFGESLVRTFRNGSGGFTFTGIKTYVVVKWTSYGLFPLAWQ